VIGFVDRFPGEDERVETDQIRIAGGGNASTAAVAAARLGVEVDFAGVVGDDDTGRALLEELEREGVGVRHATIRQGAESGKTIVIVTGPTAARTIITRPAPAPDRVPDGYDWVHLDKTGYEALAAGPPSGSRLSLDDGGRVRDLDLALLDLYAPTAEVLVERFGSTDPLAAGRAAIAAGAGMVVATAGAAGSFGVTAETSVFAPALPVRPVSSLGAGDVFHGALLAALVLGRALPEAIRFANVTAALSCRGVDGRSGIPTRDEVEDALNDLPPNGAAAERALANAMQGYRTVPPDHGAAPQVATGSARPSR
jgi:sugar/nucleoside kinase (ribokinase family)